MLRYSNNIIKFFDRYFSQEIKKSNQMNEQWFP